MILVDFSQISIANLHQQLRQGKQRPGMENVNEVLPNMLRHMILNSIRKINREFGQQYGSIVICTDNNNYWRKGFFKYYKAMRKHDRDESDIDWTTVFQVLNELRDELREYFPYKVMDVSMAEADDVIAVLAERFKQTEPILIVSSDKDFIQLLDTNVSIYRPVQDELMAIQKPMASVDALFEEE